MDIPKERITEELKSIQNRKKETINALWNKNRESLQYTLQPEETELNDSIPGNILRDVGNIKPKNKSQVTLPFVKPLPNENMWIPVSRNIIGRDQTTLESIPCVDYGNIDVDFISDLIDAYNGKWYGANKNKTSFIDDDIFIDLIKALTKVCQNAEKNSIETFPELKIFEIVSNYFKNSFSAAELQAKYVKLTTKTPSSTLKSDSTRDLLVPYRKLFCRRCCIYGCPYHLNDTNNRTPFKRKIEGFSEPCSDKCYKIKKSSLQSQENVMHGSTKQAMQRLISRQNIDDLPSTSSSLAEDSVWTDIDKSMVYTLHNVFAKNYCFIAICMFNKTCYEVYEFIQRNFEENDGDNNTVMDDESKKPSKKFKGQLCSKMYTPCSHAGSCDGNVKCLCQCCEKYCDCTRYCPKKPPTCQCKTDCTKNDQCLCLLAYRECDPNICGCDNCQNLNIQLGRKKKVRIKPSDVHGWGVFIEEDCKSNEFIGEYCGEIISNSEADRRGKLYEKLNSVFLFDLKDGYVIDATRMGSKIRFVNHSKENFNCVARVMTVYGDHRVGLYATRDIKKEQELLIDYYSYNPSKNDRD